MERQGSTERYARIFAVDFDGTLNLAEKYPLLGEPNEGLFRFLKRRQQAGDKIILWTCREGDYLKSAVKFCRRYGLAFDAVNDNLPENKEYFGNNSRKVYAHYYVDDRNVYFPRERKGASEMKETRVESIGKVDFSEVKMPMIAVYESPEDFPGECVARIYDLDKPTDTVMVKGTMEEVQRDIRENTGMVFLPRGAEDVPSLVGVWM